MEFNTTCMGLAGSDNNFMEISMSNATLNADDQM